MYWLGTIGRTALKAVQSNNTIVLRQSPQSPNYVSNRLMNMFRKMSIEVESKAPERPKRPTSGYNSYYKDIAVKLRAENPQMRVQELAKAIGDQWKKLDPNIKQEIIEKSKRNSEEYKEQIEKWRKSLNEKQKESYLLTIRSRKQALAKRRLRSELKNLDYPIRPKTAFNLYVKEAINNIQRSDEPFSQVFKRVVANWSTVSPEDKASYVESAKIDKIRYMEELNKWQEDIKTADKKQTLDRLTKLKNISSKSYLNTDLKSKTKKVVKKKPKATKLKAKTKTKTKAKKFKAKGKVDSMSSIMKTRKSKSKLSSDKKSTKSPKRKKSNEKSKESKAKKTKKQESDSSSSE